MPFYFSFHFPFLSKLLKEKVHWPKKKKVQKQRPNSQHVSTNKNHSEASTEVPKQKPCLSPPAWEVFMYFDLRSSVTLTLFLKWKILNYMVKFAWIVCTNCLRNTWLYEFSFFLYFNHTCITINNFFFCQFLSQEV